MKHFSCSTISRYEEFRKEEEEEDWTNEVRIYTHCFYFIIGE